MRTTPLAALRLASVALLALVYPLAAQNPQFVDGNSGTDFRWSPVVKASAAALAAGEVTLLLDWQDAGNHYALTLKGDRAQFQRVQAGKATPLGVSSALYRGSDDGVLRLSIHRSEWGLAAYCNRVLCARAEDRALAPGKCGWQVKGDGLSVEPGTLQTVEELFFSDDFMRTDDQLGGWEATVGKWENNQQGSKVSRSANAFSFRSKGGEPCIAVHGNPFDHDYVVQAAVRSDNAGALGLVVGYQDEKNYYLMKWTAAANEDGGTCRLQRMFDGKLVDLTPPIPGGYLPDVWYKLQLSLAGGWVYGWIDDVPLFEVAAQAFGEGRIGLYSGPAAGEQASDATAGALFDDVVQRSWPLFTDDFAQPSSGRWTAEGAAWDIKTGNGAAGVANAPASGRLWCGADNWEGVTFDADVQYGGGAVGLAAGRSGASPGYVATLTADRTAISRLGDKQPLASVAKGLTTGAWHHLSFSAEGGLLRLSVDGDERLEALVGGEAAGRCALVAEGAVNAQFTNVRARFRPTFYALPPTLPAEFVQDRYMTAWASPGAAWVQVEGSPARWHKGFFYGDRKVHFEVPGLGKQAGRVVVALGANDTKALDGYRLQLTLTAGQKTIALALMLGDKAVAQGQAKCEGDSAEVNFELTGHYIQAIVDGTTALTYRIPEVTP